MEINTSPAVAEGQSAIKPAFVGETGTIIEKEVNTEECERQSDQVSLDSHDGVKNKMAARESPASLVEEKAVSEQCSEHLGLGHRSGEEEEEEREEDRTKMAAKTNMAACMEPKGGEAAMNRNGEDFPVQFRVQETNFSKGQLKLTLKTMKEGKMAAKNKKLKGLAVGSKANMKPKKGKVTAKKVQKKVTGGKHASTPGFIVA